MLHTRSQSDPMVSKLAKLELEDSSSPTEFRLLSTIEEGAGGCYLVEKDGKRMVFKPQSEEKYDVNENLEKVPVRAGVFYGETPRKELAAYLLDHEHFAGVPETEMGLTNFREYPTIGSYQAYKAHECSAEDMGPSFFPTSDVHRIGLLDIRLLNLDRHLGNILVGKDTNGFHLTPIDHGYCLPSYSDVSDVNFEWLYWSQCKEPFSKETLDYIKRVDSMRDACLLSRLGLRNESIVGNILATLFLQRCAAAGLTLYTIANMVQRQGSRDTPSVFENLIEDIVKRSQVESLLNWPQMWSILLLLCMAQKKPKRK